MLISCFCMPLHLKAIRSKAPAHDQVCQRPLRPYRRRKALWVSTGHAPYTAAAACSSLSYASLALFQPGLWGLDQMSGLVDLWFCATNQMYHVSFPMVSNFRAPDVPYLKRTFLARLRNRWVSSWTLWRESRLLPWKHSTACFVAFSS